jgi:hypothetical protein
VREPRGALAAAAALAAAVLVLLAAPAVPAAPRCDGCLVAGAASVALRVPDGTPLAGYGSLARRLLVPDLFDRQPHAFWFRPHGGALDALHARALVLEASGQRLVWIAVDLIAVGRELTARLARRLAEAGLPPGALVLSASHTHSGPGAFVDSALMGFVAVDREDATVRDALVDSMVEAVRRADAAKVPARVGVATSEAPGTTTGRLGQRVDPTIVVVKVVGEDGAPIAALWNFAIHGTMLGAGNLKLSADVMGAASAAIERDLGAVALFVNGAVGDVSPARHGAGELVAVGRALAEGVRSAWDRAEPSRRAALEVRSTRLSLPAPRLSLRNCTGRWMPRGLTLPLDGAFPDAAELLGGRVGDAAWVTIPGELQSALGERIRRAAVGTPAIIAGLSNDYLGYFLTADDYARVTYVACTSLYGPAAGERLAQAAADLVRAVRGAGK